MQWVLSVHSALGLVSAKSWRSGQGQQESEIIQQGKIHYFASISYLGALCNTIIFQTASDPLSYPFPVPVIQSFHCILTAMNSPGKLKLGKVQVIRFMPFFRALHYTSRVKSGLWPEHTTFANEQSNDCWQSRSPTINADTATTNEWCNDCRRSRSLTVNSPAINPGLAINQSSLTVHAAAHFSHCTCHSRSSTVPSLILWAGTTSHP